MNIDGPFPLSRMHARGAARLMLAGLIAVAMVTPALGARVAPDFIVSRGATPAPHGFVEFCGANPWVCGGFGRARAEGAEAMRRAIRINFEVNATTRQISDRDQYGREDVWAMPTERGGDCEDIAILKKQRLIAAGIAPANLMIATVLDTRRDNHAVLVLRSETGDVVLDNLRDGVLPWRATGYTFLTMQDPGDGQTWDMILAGGLLDQ